MLFVKNPENTVCEIEILVACRGAGSSASSAATVLVLSGKEESILVEKKVAE